MSEPGLPRRRRVATGHVVRRRFRRVLLACSAVAVASGCGIEPDAAPRPVPLEQRALFGGQATGDIAAGSSRIYLLAPTGQDEPARLRSVLRDVGDDPEALLTSLFAGPNADEADAQLVSRIPPDLELRSVRQVGRTLNVDLATGFGDLDPGAVRLAVAQIVITADQIDGVQAVRLRVDGEPQAWPVGDGELVTRLLTSFDYPGLVESTQPAYPSVPAPA